MAHGEHHGHENGTGYEVQDASIREVVFTGVGLAVGTILVCVAVFVLFRVLHSTEVQERRPVMAIQVPATFPPTPRLQAKPAEELQIVRHDEDQVLTTYGWVNKSAGLVRIPIDRAMQIVIERGLPVRKEGAPAQPAAPAQAAPAQGTATPQGAASPQGGSQRATQR